MSPTPGRESPTIIFDRAFGNIKTLDLNSRDNGVGISQQSIVPGR